MKPLPGIHNLSQTVQMFNQGCASFERAMHAFENKNSSEFQTALQGAARDIPDVLEWALKIYLENFPELDPQDRRKLDKPSFSDLINLMEKYADPPLTRETRIRLFGYRAMRNKVTHQGAIPPVEEVQNAIEGTRQTILTYIPGVEEDHLKRVSGLEEAGEIEVGVIKERKPELVTPSQSPTSSDVHPQAESRSAVFTHGHALLIGVGADLPITVQDATALHDLLIDPHRAAYPSGQVKLLTEIAANRHEILTAFDRLAERVNATAEATAIVYFSGHGGRFELSEKTAEYFLVPFGYDPSRRADTAISGLEFTTKIEAIKARKLVVLLDCCHAGGVPMLKAPGETFVKSPVPPELLNRLDTGSGQIVIASSHENEYSYTGTPYSVFTACLLEALTGKAAVNKDGFARILDVLIYLFQQVPQRASGQHPFVKKVLDLGDNFPLCYYAGGKHVPGEVSGPEPAPAFAGLTTERRRRLERRYDSLWQEWDLRSEKVKRMRKDLAIQTSVTITFQLEQQLLDEEAQLARLGDELEEIERRLQQ
jgi:hypothetical protein